jgi:hypothetical protein
LLVFAKEEDLLSQTSRGSPAHSRHPTPVGNRNDPYPERTDPGYRDWPLVLPRLAEVDVERLAELVTDAWRMRAPEAGSGWE